MSQEKRAKYAYKTTLKNVYGLTESWIKRLGEPDKLVPNPHYSSAPQGKLYLRARVELFIEENQAEYDKLLAGRAARQARGEKAAATRMAKYRDRVEVLEKWGRQCKIIIQELPRSLERLEKDVWEAGLELSRDGFFTMSYNAILAYTRHNLTNYESLLYEFEEKAEGVPQTYVGETYCRIKDRTTRLAHKKLINAYGPKITKKEK